MITTSATRVSATLATLPARNLWAAVAILLNLLSSQALPAARSPALPAPVAAREAAANLPGLRGRCEPCQPCSVGRMALPMAPLSIRPPSRTRSWRYRAAFG